MGDLDKKGTERDTAQYSLADLQRLKQERIVSAGEGLSKSGDLAHISGIQSGISHAVQERCDDLDLKFKLTELLDNALMNPEEPILLTPELYKRVNFFALCEMGQAPDEPNYQIYEFALKAPNGKSIGKVTCYVQNFLTKAWKIEKLKV